MSRPNNGNSGSPKGSLFNREPIGDGILVVSSNKWMKRGIVCKNDTKFYSTKAGNKNSLRGSVKMEDKKLLINIKNIASLKNLVLAYELIKSKPGNMTPGNNLETLDGLTKKTLESMNEKLKNGTYSFSPGRRIMIPKPGKDEKRPLTIASPREKIVQKAIVQIMEPHYETKFSKTSFGFRPKLGVKDALLYLDANFQSVK